MEVCDGTLTLGGIYHQLMELDSIERILSDQIVSVGIHSIRAKSCGYEDWPDVSFQGILHELEQARDKVASLHSSMREAANAYSRSRIRSLNILDLPDELLRAIFEQSRKCVSTEDYFFIPDIGHLDGRKDIKNIRLTCRRFCNTSSHLLLRHIDVSMHPPSLAHLGEVARHPLLSKGIQAIRVHLNYFSAGLTDTRHFTALAIMYLEDELDFYRLYLQRDSNQELVNLPREKVGPVIDKAERILEEWSEFLDVLRDSDGDPEVFKDGIAKSKEVAGLASAHEIYRQQYLAQESVLEDGAFVQAIVTAMSTMPTAKRLFVGDSFRDFNNRRHDYVKPLMDVVEDPEGLAASGMVRPLDWDTAWSKQLNDQPKEIFLQLFMAVFENSIPINHLGIYLSSAADMSIPATQKHLQQLAAGTEHLRVFEFRGLESQSEEIGPIVDYGPEQNASFCSLISSCMGGKALTRLDLDLSFALDEFAPEPYVSMGSLLVSRHCPDLEILRLSCFPLHLKELKTFLESLNGPLCICLEDVLLLSGTWAEALDLIRHKASWESYVIRPRGSECDDMSEDDILILFGKDSYPSYGKAGKATRYIRGNENVNPLRIREVDDGVAVEDGVGIGVGVLDDPLNCSLLLLCPKLRRIIRGGAELNAGGPAGGGGGGGGGGAAAADCTGLVVGAPPGGGGAGADAAIDCTGLVVGGPGGGGGGGAGAEAATDCTGLVVGGPGGGGGAGGVEGAAGPPIFLGVVDVEVALVCDVAGPKARLPLGLPPGTPILEVGAFSGEPGGTGTDAGSEGRIFPTPKRRLDDAAGVLGGGTPGPDEDGRGGVTGGGGAGRVDEDVTLTEDEAVGTRDVDDTVTVTGFGDVVNIVGQKSSIEVIVMVDTGQIGNGDGDEIGGVTTADDDRDDDGRGTDGAGGMLEDVLGGVGETLGVDGLDEEAGAAGLVEMPGTLLVEDEASTGPT